MKIATILEMPEIIEILETTKEGVHPDTLEAIRLCRYKYLSDSKDSLVLCYQGQPGVFHVHILSKPRLGLASIDLLQKVIAHLFENLGATVVLGITPASARGWRILLSLKKGDSLNYVDLPENKRMSYFTLDDYRKYKGKLKNITRG